MAKKSAGKEKVKKGKDKAEPKVKKAKKVKELDDSVEQGLDLSSLYADVLDDVATRQGADSPLSADVVPMSTGLLAYDLILNGGLRPAWYTGFGPEQSAKTTGALTIAAGAVTENVPIVRFVDYEGSSSNSKPYIRNIFRTAGVKGKMDYIFGKVDPETGKYIEKPRVYYTEETVLEKFFNHLADLLRTLPDKKRIGREWWLVFEDNKKNKAKYGEVANKAMARKHGAGLYIPAKDGALQALVITDSYPAMNPIDDDDGDPNNALALQARAFSKNLRRVKGRMAQKMVAVWGINQLRAVPMARYGPPETEPGGQALRYYSDGRIRHTPRAIGGVPTTPKPKENPDDKATEVEDSVQYDGQDTYRYVAIKADKHKLGTPKRVAWFRIWVEDGAGNAQGIDPVYDTYFYLWSTGQANGSKKNAIRFDLEGMGEGKKTISWQQFKLWVLGDKDAKTGISKILGYKPMCVRKFCFAQMKSGVGERLYVATKTAKKKAKKEKGDGVGAGVADD